MKLETQSKLDTALNYILSVALSMMAMLLTADRLIPALEHSRGYRAIGGEVILIASIGLAVYHLLMLCLKGGNA